MVSVPISQANLWYQLGYRLSGWLGRVLFDFQALHAERIPAEGGCIVACNHESYLDPPLVGISAERTLFYLARKTLREWPVLGPILPALNVVPVDQDRPDMAALKTVIKHVRAGGGTIIFPEGSRTEDGTFLPAQPGLGLVIAKTLAPVVPCRLFGAHRAFPRGGRPRPFTRITLVVGEPLFFQKEELVGEGRELYQRLSERVLARIALITNERE